MLQSILTIGLIQTIQKSPVRTEGALCREELSLPLMPSPKNMEKFVGVLNKVAIEKI
jgi:hypothetical protein